MVLPPCCLSSNAFSPLLFLLPCSSSLSNLRWHSLTWLCRVLTLPFCKQVKLTNPSGNWNLFLLDHFTDLFMSSFDSYIVEVRPRARTRQISAAGQEGKWKHLFLLLSVSWWKLIGTSQADCPEQHRGLKLGLRRIYQILIVLEVGTRSFWSWRRPDKPLVSWTDKNLRDVRWGSSCVPAFSPEHLQLLLHCIWHCASLFKELSPWKSVLVLWKGHSLLIEQDVLASGTQQKLQVQGSRQDLVTGVGQEAGWHFCWWPDWFRHLHLVSTLSVRNSDMALTQLTILMLSIRDRGKNANVVPSHRVEGDFKLCGQHQDSCVILPALQLTVTITRMPLLFYL